MKKHKKKTWHNKAKELLEFMEDGRTYTRHALQEILGITPYEWKLIAKHLIKENKIIRSVIDRQTVFYLPVPQIFSPFDAEAEENLKAHHHIHQLPKAEVAKQGEDWMKSHHLKGPLFPIWMKDSIPIEFWKTYVALANEHGGTILLILPTERELAYLLKFDWRQIPQMATYPSKEEEGKYMIHQKKKGGEIIQNTLFIHPKNFFEHKHMGHPIFLVKVEPHDPQKEGPVFIGANSYDRHPDRGTFQIRHQKVVKATRRYISEKWEVMLKPYGLRLSFSKGDGEIHQSLRVLQEKTALNPTEHGEEKQKHSPHPSPTISSKGIQDREEGSQRFQTPIQKDHLQPLVDLESLPSQSTDKAQKEEKTVKKQKKRSISPELEIFDEEDFSDVIEELIEAVSAPIRNKKRVRAHVLHQAVLELCALKPMTEEELMKRLGRGKLTVRKAIKMLYSLDKIKLIQGSHWTATESQ